MNRRKSTHSSSGTNQQLALKRTASGRGQGSQSKAREASSPLGTKRGKGL